MKNNCRINCEPERGSRDSGGQPNCGSDDRPDGEPFFFYGSNEYPDDEFICVSDLSSYESYGETREIQWSKFQEMATKDVALLDHIESCKILN